MPLLLRNLGIPEGVAFFPDQGAYAAGDIAMEEMPGIYGAVDVLLGAAMAGGFELPLLEAQACGTPAILLTDGLRDDRGSGAAFMAGAGSGLLGRATPRGFLDNAADRPHLLGVRPHGRHRGGAGGCVRAVECPRGRPPGTRCGQTSREHALQYDADTVLRDYWVPFLAELEDDLNSKRPRKQAAPRTVWSPVMFRDELDMLEMRLHETDDLIDRHVIVEAETTHRGVPKPLYFRDSAGRFEAHASRITAVAGGALPDEQPWVNEHLQRDAAWTVIDAEASDDDIVLICDVDEIPSRSLLERAKAGDLPEVCSVRMRTFLFAVDWEVADQEALPGPRASSRQPGTSAATAGPSPRSGDRMGRVPGCP